jgi:hypothetical protein
MPVDLFQKLKGLYAELQQEAAAPTFQKIQQYAVLAASTALAMQIDINTANSNGGAGNLRSDQEVEMSNSAWKIY